MSNEKTLEIIRGLSQAASNAYDGSHDERFSLDGQTREIGLRREAGCPIMDSRVIDGFSVKFYGDSMIINYQSDIRMKELKNLKFENEIAATINDVKKFLQKEYKAITGNSISLTAKGECRILVQQTSNVRTFIQAYQHYKVGGLSMDGIGQPSEPTEREVTRKFLEQFSDKRPSNDTRPKGSNQK